jgi:hypothetical protein
MPPIKYSFESWVPNLKGFGNRSGVAGGGPTAMKPTGARYQEVAEKYCDDAVKQVDLIRSGSRE